MPSTFLPVQVVPPLGLEPRTRGLKVRCSNHLSYGGSPSVAMLPSSCEATRVFGGRFSVLCRNACRYLLLNINLYFRVGMNFLDSPWQWQRSRGSPSQYPT